MNREASVHEELVDLGNALGGLHWVQGPGGNVSVKTDDGVLLVKASGTRIRDVASATGHASVSLATATKALDGDAAADAELFARAPRPSLETYFHALPGRVVAHTHPIGVHLYACSTATTRPKFVGQVHEIPYVRPGRAVALAMREVLSPDADEQLVILRSHGLVAFAPTAARAIALTLAFDEAVRAPFADLPSFDALVVSYRSAGAVQTFATGVLQPLPPRRSNATATTPPRYLFPDAPVCASVTLVDAFDATNVQMLAAQVIAATKRAGVLVDPAGNRALFAKNEDQLGQSLEVLAAHDWVEDVLLSKGTARYLSDDEPAGIVNMPSEQYRIRLAAHVGGRVET